MKTNVAAKPAELLEQAAQTYFGAVKNGIKMQEEAAARWVDLFRKSDGVEYLPQAFQQAIKETVPLVQKQTDDALELIEKGTKQSLDLLSKAFEAGQSESPVEAQARVEKLWESCLGAMQENAEAMVQANARMMESWATAAKKQVERVTPAAAKAKAA